MIEVIKFKKEHMLELLELPNNINEKHLYANCNYEYLEANASYTLINEVTKKVICVCGILPYWQDRAEGWIIFSDNVKRYLFGIHRIVKSFLNKYPARRIEAVVPKNPMSHKWIKSLDFKLEAETMRHYWPNGDDFSLYARIK